MEHQVDVIECWVQDRLELSPSRGGGVEFTKKIMGGMAYLR